MKRHRLSTRGLLVFLLCAFLGSVFALSALAVYLDNNGIKPEEDAVSATLYLKGPYSYHGEFTDEFHLRVDGKQGVADLRALEDKVKSLTLKEYTSMIVWEGTFTYKKADGTEEQRTYRKSNTSEDIKKFLDKYYVPPAEGSESE